MSVILDDRLTKFLAERGSRALPTAEVIALTGDASDRRYFRLLIPERPTVVLALHSAPFTFATLPFVNVTELLQQVPLPVPEVLGHAEHLGILIVSDLGDVTLQSYLAAATTEEKAALYREAIDLLLLLQERGEALRDSRYLPYGLAFDVEKLTWEMDFFIKHFVVGYCAVGLDEPTREELRAELGTIVEELAAMPRVLCHRDYHSRNLMLHRARLNVIDHQDARMGPATYDLASLLRDSYVELDEAFVDEMVEYFCAGQAAGRPVDRGAFRGAFDVMSLQRNLKALGTFGYQTTVRQNPVYRQYVPRTLGYARFNLLKYPRFEHLHGILAGLMPELQ